MNSSISNNSVLHKSTVSMSKTVLFQAIQFSTQFSSIWSLDRTLLGDITPGQSGPRSNGNEEVLSILQSSSITGSLPSDCLVSYPGHSLGGGFLHLCREAVGILDSTGILPGYLSFFMLTVPEMEIEWFTLD